MVIIEKLVCDERTPEALGKYTRRKGRVNLDAEFLFLRLGASLR
jgi:hypothetical protein